MRNGFLTKDEFRYDPALDVSVCRAGETLAPYHEGKLRDLKKIRLQQSDGAPHLSCPVVMDYRPPDLASGQRGSAGSDGRSLDGQALDISRGAVRPSNIPSGRSSNG